MALLKHEINDRVPGSAVLCCLLGAVGLLVFAARMSVSVRLTAATETDPRYHRSDHLPRVGAPASACWWGR